MKLEIQEAIESLVPPEQLNVMLSTIDLLLSQDYTEALDELNTVFMIADDYADSSMLVGRIHDILVYALNCMLTQYGITVTDDANLNTRLAVMNTVLNIPQYIIPTDLVHIFQCGYGDIETLARLVEFFTNLHLDDLINSIESVNDSTLSAIHSDLNTRIQTLGEFEGTRIPHDRIKVINQLIQTNGSNRFSMLLELANAGVRVGRPFDELMHISFESLESSDPVTAAAQMTGLAFFSDLPLKAIWSKLDVSLNDYTDNPMERKLMLDTFMDIKRKLGEFNVNA